MNKLVIVIVGILLGGYTGVVFASETTTALGLPLTVDGMVGFGMGAVSGFGFAMTIVVGMYKKKADAYDKLMQDLASAKLSERT